MRSCMIPLMKSRCSKIADAILIAASIISLMTAIWFIITL